MRRTSPTPQVVFFLHSQDEAEHEEDQEGEDEEDDVYADPFAGGAVTGSLFGGEVKLSCHSKDAAVLKSCVCIMVASLVKSPSSHSVGKDVSKSARLLQ